MAANLNSIKNRIGVVNNTKKITHAMELVAASKLRKAKAKYQGIQEYKHLLSSTFDSLMNQINTSEFKLVFPDHKDVEARLFLVITSDLGLCGSYNSNVMNLLKENLNSKDKVILFGSKGLSTWKSWNLDNEVVASFTNYGDEIGYKIANLLAKKVLTLYRNKEVKSINIIYTEFVNNVFQDAKNLQLIPFVLDENKVTKKSPVHFEPNSQTVLSNAIPLYISSQIYSLGLSSKVSELASRRNAMENATDNAHNLLNDLNLEYNHKRQSAITQEINEIVSGADAT
ncbi:ATP synthase F1 subunit gamma [Mycoplasma sp. Ms02]|uniref:ATP synthase F1 subunit gamma n=1 Tax=Mycoplasma sp. Ms02 TaxID=353851 RepID=UPI001C8A8B0C|nr:ATP synthase F1 subunit gamma [Mycoplasma sp. Ms02]QZE12433.1 F0F1 ATP synthase subunit gamma [Mycoplasma sp. Ms02]